MNTTNKVRDSFLKEFQDLLNRYNARITTEIQNEKINMTVWVPSIWNENDEMERAGAAIDLGNYMSYQ